MSAPPFAVEPARRLRSAAAAAARVRVKRALRRAGVAVAPGAGVAELLRACRDRVSGRLRLPK